MKSIHRHGARVERILEGMRQLSQAKGGKHAPADLNDLVSKVVSALRNTDASEGTRITTALDPGVGEIDLVVRDLGAALLNILHNALYAVRARAASAPAGWSPRVIVATRDLGEAVEVKVRDDGDGIPAAVRARVFEPFFTTKPSGEGVGLGLSIAHDVIVKVHGGSIDIESEVGQFTELRVTIPRGSGCQGRGEGPPGGRPARAAAAPGPPLAEEPREGRHRRRAHHPDPREREARRARPHRAAPGREGRPVAGPLDRPAHPRVVPAEGEHERLRPHPGALQEDLPRRLRLAQVARVGEPLHVAVDVAVADDSHRPDATISRTSSQVTASGRPPSIAAVFSARTKGTPYRFRMGKARV